MRTSAMVHRPGHITAGRSSHEIVADLDRYPTIANRIGEQSLIPVDRPIDGIHQGEFLLGEQEKSNRDYVVTYVGDTAFA